MADLAALRASLADRYRLERELGQGGMATVYLARDLRHDRDVAIKVLREDLAASLGAARFLREIQIAAQLQHPNILPLLDSGDANGFLFYVMPYVAGQSLRERIAREGELPIHDAVRLLTEVVDALAHAHEHGVVHRDIKPDNVMVSGRHALVTDFGVAKAVSEATGGNLVTTLGVALGTPTYMSPEQAAADPHVDHRSDIYAVGVMAYELLTGRPPFTGATPQQVLASHVTEAPDPVSKRRAAIAPALEAVVMRCLEKRPADRWQTAGELLAQLEPLATPTSGTTPYGTVPIAAVRRDSRRRLLLGVGGAAVVAALLWAGWQATRSRPFEIRTANIRQVTRDPVPELHVAISPDGRQVAYQQGPGPLLSKVVVRDIAGGSPVLLTEDWEGAQLEPGWMPDGRHVMILNAFATADHGAGPWKLPRLGGQAVQLDSSDWLALNGGHVVRVDSAAMRVRILTSAGLERSSWPATGQEHSGAWGPDGRVAWVVGNTEGMQSTWGNVAPSSVWVGVVGGPAVRVTDSTSMNLSPQWLPDGTLLFVSNRDGARDIYALRIDDAGNPRGEAMRITTGLAAWSISVSADGATLAYDRFTLRRNIYAIDISTGAAVSVRTARAITTGSQTVENLDVSADGRWLAFDSDLEGNQDIYLMSTEGGEPRRITRDPGDDFSPDLSADGSEIAFHSTRGATRDIYRISIDGSGEIRLTDDPGESMHPAWSPDGLALTYSNAPVDSSTGVFVLRRRAKTDPWGPAERVGRPGTFASRWSPDGSELVYDARSSGSETSIEILRPGAAPRTLAIDATARLRSPVWPDWSADGTVIHFVAFDRDRELGLYQVAATGGVPRQLVRFDDPAMLPYPSSITVVNGMAYMAIAEIESDIYVMDLIRDGR